MIRRPGARGGSSNSTTRLCVHKSTNDLRHYGIDVWNYVRNYTRNADDDMCLPMLVANLTMYGRKDLAAAVDAIIAALMASDNQGDRVLETHRDVLNASTGAARETCHRCGGSMTAFSTDAD